MSMPGTLVINGLKYVGVDGDNLAGAVADLHADEQARFFNDLGAMARSWPSPNFGEQQWASMADHLDENGRGVLRSMAQFLDK